MAYNWRIGPIEFEAYEVSSEVVMAEGFIGNDSVVQFATPDNGPIERIACASRERVLELLKEWHTETVNQDIKIRKV